MNKNYESDQCAQGYQARGSVIGAGLVGAQMQQGMAAECGRQSAKGYLHDKVRRLRIEADRLEALAGALPEKLPYEADEALWQLLRG